MSYKHAPVPFEPRALVEYLSRELPRLAEHLNRALGQQMVVYHTIPDRPADGLYYADGSDWDPGSGRGLYRYDSVSATYVFLG